MVPPRWWCEPCLPSAVSGRYLSFPSVRRSRSTRLKVLVCGQSLAGSDGTRRRSRVSCAATRRRVRAGSTTSRRSRSGMPSDELGVRRRRSWSRTSASATTCNNGSPVSSDDRWPGCRGPAGPNGTARTNPIGGPKMGAGLEPAADRDRLRVDFPDDESMRISHEAIYQALYVQGRGALKRELVACLRTGRALRVPEAGLSARRGLTSPRSDDQRTPRRGRRSSRSRPLGRRLVDRARALRHRHACRTHHPLHDADPSAPRRGIPPPAHREARARRSPATARSR